MSSAFVFVLVEAINDHGLLGTGLQGIKGAMDILQYLSGNGNKAAEKRIVDVNEICQHLDITLEAHTSSPATPNPSVDRNQERIEGTAATDILESISQNVRSDMKAQAALSRVAPTSQSDWRYSLASSMDDTVFDANQVGPGTTFENDLVYGGNNLEFSFDFDRDFVLTGADETDWEEFERQIARLQ